MQKHVEIDEPEESHELDAALFGVAAPSAVLVEEEADAETEDLDEQDEVEDEETVAEAADVGGDGLDEAEELAEDMLEVEEDVDLVDPPEGDAPDFDEEL
jgi:hypothetical protein